MEHYKKVKNFAIPAIIAALALVIIMPIHNYLNIGLMDTLANSDTRINPLQMLPIMALSLLSVVLNMAMTVLGLLWVYFAAKNKFELGFGDTIKTASGKEIKNISAMWSAVWLLIPFANIVMWYFVLKQIWFASNLKPYNDKSCPWNFLRAYWLALFLCVLACIAITCLYFPFGAAQEDMLPIMIKFNKSFMMVCSINAMAFNLLAAFTIAKITRAQKRAFLGQGAIRQ